MRLRASRPRLSRACVAAIVAAGLATAFAPDAGAMGSATAPPPTAGASTWSHPQVIAPCSAGAPQIAFPSSSPANPSGPGAILWLIPQGGCGGSSPATSAKPGLSLSWLDASEHTDGSVAHALPAGAAPALQAIGGSEGRVTAVEPVRTVAEVLQARHGGALARVLALPLAGPVSITRGYLGDVAVAADEPGDVIAVTVQRHYPSPFGAPIKIPVGHGAVSALAVTMDFRSDLLVAWQQQGSIYGHVIRATGRSEATQRIGPSAPDPELEATVSDNNHGMVAWSSTEPGSGGTPQTIVRLALSGVNVRFGTVRTIAAFADPARLGRLAGTLGLVRLSGENVMLAWTERDGGRYRVLVSPAVFAGTRPPTVLTATGEQDALAGLAAGPDDEAIVLWRRLGGDPARWSEAALWAARANFALHDRVALQPDAQVSAEGSSVQPALAVDPGDDHAVVAWLGSAGLGYAVASGNATYKPHAYVARATAGGSHPVAAAVAGVLLVLVAAGWFVHLRRRRPPPTDRVRRWPL